MNKKDYLKRLSTADPVVAEKVIDALKKNGNGLSVQQIGLLVEEAIWGLTQEQAFGEAVAQGFARLLGQVDDARIDRYRILVRRAGQTGPTLGRIMAVHLVPFLLFGDEFLLDLFLDTVAVMHRKGTHVMASSLEILSVLLCSGEALSTQAYLHLLKSVFSQDLTYVQGLHLAHTLPAAVQSFHSSKRPWQIQQLLRVVQADVRLTDAFLSGFQKGLFLLSRAALKDFVSSGLILFNKNRHAGKNFLSLDSRQGMKTFHERQVTVPLSMVQGGLNRYVQARTGHSISIRPTSSLPEIFSGLHCRVFGQRPPRR